MLITIDLILKIFLLQTRCPTPSQSKWATRSSTYQLSRWVNIKQKLVSNVWWKGSDRCFALPSPVSASSHPLLVLRQQQFASTGISLVILLLVNLLLVIVHLFLIILLTGGSSGFLLAKSALCGTHALGHRGSRRRCRTVSVHGQEWGFFCLTFSWLFFLCFTSQMEIAMTKMFWRMTMMMTWASYRLIQGGRAVSDSSPSSWAASCCWSVIHHLLHRHQQHNHHHHHHNHHHYHLILYFYIIHI